MRLVDASAVLGNSLGFNLFLMSFDFLKVLDSKGSALLFEVKELLFLGLFVGLVLLFFLFGYGFWRGGNSDGWRVLNGAELGASSV